MVVHSPYEWDNAVIRLNKESCKRQELQEEHHSVHDFEPSADYYCILWYDAHGSVPIPTKLTTMVQARLSKPTK